MKRVFLITLLVAAFLTESCHSKAVPPRKENRQRPAWLKTEFNNVVTIDRSNTAILDGFFLIDEVFDSNTNTVPTFFLQMQIPLSLFEDMNGFYPELKEFVLVIPDWEFYQKIAEEATKNGISIEPATTNYYYHFNRCNGKVLIDDYHISGEGHPQFTFKQPAASKTKLTVYRTEQYGSICFRKDHRQALLDQDALFIRNYEKQHGLKVNGTYLQILGEECEYIKHYTLQGLSAKERLAFLLAKNAQWQGKVVFDQHLPKILAPTAVPNVSNGRYKMQPTTY